MPCVLAVLDRSARGTTLVHIEQVFQANVAFVMKRILCASTNIKCYSTVPRPTAPLQGSSLECMVKWVDAAHPVRSVPAPGLGQMHGGRLIASWNAKAGMSKT